MRVSFGLGLGTVEDPPYCLSATTCSRITSFGMSECVHTIVHTCPNVGIAPSESDRHHVFTYSYNNMVVGVGVHSQYITIELWYCNMELYFPSTNSKS